MRMNFIEGVTRFTNLRKVAAFITKRDENSINNGDGMKFQRMTVLAVCLAFISTIASAVTLQDVIAKHLEARGGVDKLTAMTTVKVTGSMNTQGGEMKFTQSMKDNKKFRVDITVQGMNMIQAFDGTVGWGTNPMGGNKPEKAGPETAKRLPEEADWVGVFIDTEKKGYKLELVGSVDLEGSTVYKVKITNKDGEDRFTYIDAVTWLVVKEDKKMNFGGGDMDMELYYTNYQEVNGVQVPMQTDYKFQGQDVMSMTFDKIETGMDLPDSMFAFPEQK